MKSVSTEQNDQLVAFHEAIGIATECYTPVELAFWLNAPQPLLDNWTPVQLLGGGKAEQLLNVMESLESGVHL